MSAKNNNNSLAFLAHILRQIEIDGCGLIIVVYVNCPLYFFVKVIVKSTGNKLIIININNIDNFKKKITSHRTTVSIVKKLSSDIT